MSSKIDYVAVEERLKRGAQHERDIAHNLRYFKEYKMTDAAIKQ